MTMKVGLIGCGHIGAFHSRNIKDVQRRGLADISYHAACDRDIGRAEKFAAIAGCLLATDSTADVIAACDAVYICTETSEHPALVLAAAAAGKHVFCEKPLARSLDEARGMTDAVVRAGVTHQAGLVLNYSPVYRVLAQLLAETPGPLLTAHLRDDQCFPIGGHYGSAWRADQRRAGSGTLLEHSIHDLDLLRRLFGEIERVRCHTRNTAGHSGIENLAVVTCHHQGGAVTTLSSIWHDVSTRQSNRHLEVFCAGTRFDTSHDYFGSISREHGDEPPVILSSDDVLTRFMAAEGLHPEDEDLRSLAGLCDRRFLQAAAAGTRTAPGFDDALTAHVIVDACYRSAAEDREVELTVGYHDRSSTGMGRT